MSSADRPGSAGRSGAAGAAWFEPDWPAPRRVRALSTQRAGGVSTGRYASLNLATHVGDDASNVALNRERLRAELPAEPRWLEQVHGTRVIGFDERQADAAQPVEADAAVTRTPGRVLAVMTADCLPVLLTDRAGSVVAVAHAGWRGLCAGVIENAVRAMGTAGGVQGGDLLAWLGPAIGPRAYEVGADVRDAFVANEGHGDNGDKDGLGDHGDHGDPAVIDAFEPRVNGKYLADLYHLARRRLEHMGVTDVYGGDACTFGEPARFFSFRRDGVTGRMATLIWIE